MIKGFSHLTLVVKNIAKTSFLFQYLLDGIEVYSSDVKTFSLSKEKFLLIGGLWVALMEGSPLPRSYNHFAFQVEEKDIPLYLLRSKELNLEILPGRERAPEEGTSLYFYDYDNHLFELHAGSLEKRLNFYALEEPCKLMKYVQSGQVRLWTEAIGDSNQPAVVLISGAGAHAHFWTDEFCQDLVQAGYFVIRFDHRDCGLSSAVNFKEHPYTVLDLASDVIAILDAYQIQKAHVVGHSMGGTIAQLLAIHFPSRLLSFTSMSVATIGEATRPPQEVMDVLMENKPTQVFTESLEGFMKSWKVLNGDFPLDEEMAKAYTQELYERSLHPVGLAWNHIHCQENLGDLSSQLAAMTIPALFIHGEKDLLIPVSEGIKTAQATHQAKIEVIPNMGHMLFNRSLQTHISSLLIEHFNKVKTHANTFKS